MLFNWGQVNLKVFICDRTVKNQAQIAICKVLTQNSNTNSAHNSFRQTKEGVGALQTLHNQCYKTSPFQTNDIQLLL